MFSNKERTGVRSEKTKHSQIAPHLLKSLKFSPICAYLRTSAVKNPANSLKILRKTEPLRRCS
jgi:hypothetical protein